MIVVENAQDFEFYSANSAGGIQGLGYECRNDGRVSTDRIICSACVLTITRPRLIRMVTSTDWSLHDLILVDCKWTYHLWLGSAHVIDGLVLFELLGCGVGHFIALVDDYLVAILF